jgi:hypothetical protein
VGEVRGTVDGVQGPDIAAGPIIGTAFFFAEETNTRRSSFEVGTDFVLNFDVYLSDNVAVAFFADLVGALALTKSEPSPIACRAIAVKRSSSIIRAVPSRVPTWKKRRG